MAARELSEAHGKGGDGGIAACSARAGEREGVREWEWSSRDAALLSTR